MSKENTKPQASEEKPATEAQLKLANQLERELDFAEAVPDEVLRTQSRAAVSDYIHKLKEMKVRDQALRSQNTKATGFDKIGFGMMYKLCWKAVREPEFSAACLRYGFDEATLKEYKLFKEVQHFVREWVVEGGHQ